MASPIGWWMFLVKLDRTDKLLKSQTSGRRFCSAGFFVLLCIVFFTITLHLRQAALHRVALRYLNSQFLWTLFVVSVVTRAIWLRNSERLFFGWDTRPLNESGSGMRNDVQAEQQQFACEGSTQVGVRRKIVRRYSGSASNWNATLGR